MVGIEAAAAGFEVWYDVDNLTGGDGFWRNIENIIRTRAAKVIFVHSHHVKQKSGTRKEVYLALRVGERNRLTRFVIPMRIDATPFDETLIELVDLQAIDCRRDWMAGLKSLVDLLERDSVPRWAASADRAARLISQFGQSSFSTRRLEELLVSNLLPVLQPPRTVNFFSCGGLQSHRYRQLPRAYRYRHLRFIRILRRQRCSIDLLKPFLQKSELIRVLACGPLYLGRISWPEVHETFRCGKEPRRGTMLFTCCIGLGFGI